MMEEKKGNHNLIIRTSDNEKYVINIFNLSRRLEVENSSNHKNPFCLRFGNYEYINCLEFDNTCPLFLKNLELFSNFKEIKGLCKRYKFPTNQDKFFDNFDITFSNEYRKELIKWDMGLIHVLNKNECLTHNPIIYAGIYGFNIWLQNFPQKSKDDCIRQVLQYISSEDFNKYRFSLLNIVSNDLTKFPEKYLTEDFIEVYINNVSNLDDFLDSISKLNEKIFLLFLTMISPKQLSYILCTKKYQSRMQKTLRSISSLSILSLNIEAFTIAIKYFLIDNNIQNEFRVINLIRKRIKIYNDCYFLKETFLESYDNSNFLKEKFLELETEITNNRYSKLRNLSTSTYRHNQIGNTKRHSSGTKTYETINVELKNAIFLSIQEYNQNYEEQLNYVLKLSKQRTRIPIDMDKIRLEEEIIKSLLDYDDNTYVNSKENNDLISEQDADLIFEQDMYPWTNIEQDLWEE